MIVKKIIKPWIVVDYDRCRVFQFDTLKEATVFAKAEQAAWDEGMHDYCRRVAEQEEANERL